MASTYSTLKLQLMTTGENTSTWGNVTNLNLGTALEEAIVGSADVTFASATVTLALTDTNASQTARNLRLNLIGTSGGAQNLIVPAIEKVYLVNNGCADAITVKNSSGTGIAVPAGKVMWVYNDGTNVTNAVTHLTSLTLAAALPVLSGGTGVTTSTGSGNVVLSTSPTLVTPLLGTPTSGTLTNCTGVSLTAGVSGTLPVANGGTGVTSSTGSGNNVLSTSPTLVTPLLGTPTSGTLTNCTGVSLTAGVTGTLPVANGGTGLTATPSNGQLDIGNGSGFTRATLTAGSGVSITNGAGTITVSAPGTGGTVTSVAGTGTVNGITLSGTVTSSGSLTLGGTLSGVALTSQVSGTLPVANGGTGVTSSTGSGNVVLSTSPTLVTPALGTPSSGTLTNCTGVSLTAGVTGTLPVANGGTGVTSSTGSGNNVLSTSPTLVTPALGTPSSGNLTNCTGMSGLQSTQTTGTWTVPSNVVSSTRVKFRLVGGGGGGGGAATVTNATGAGGASGDYIEAVFSGFTAGQNVTASIGAAGAAGSASGGAGGDGGDTTLTYNSVTICLASRGFGGAGATTTAMTAPGTVYATSVASAGASGLTDVSSTVVNSRGAGTAGSYPVFANAGQSYISGTGGSNPMGNGGYGMVNGAPGIDATGYGGGGSGGSRASATNRAGGAGAAGCVFVEYVL